MFGEVRIWFAVGMVLRGWIQAVGWIGRLRGGARRVGRGRSLFSRGYVRYGGRVRRLEGESSSVAHFSVVAVVCGGGPVSLLSGTAGPIGFCLCRCDLCCEFARPQTAGVLDDSVLPGAGEVNGIGNMLNGILMRGCWGGVGVWAVGRGVREGLGCCGGRELGGVGGCPFGGWGNPIRL